MFVLQLEKTQKGTRRAPTHRSPTTPALKRRRKELETLEVGSRSDDHAEVAEILIGLSMSGLEETNAAISSCGLLSG